MLSITDRQVDEISASMMSNFIRRSDDFLRSQFPEAAVNPPGSLDAPIARLLRQGSAYGLTTERQLLTYVVTGWLLGLDFDSAFPAATFVLNSPEYTADDKAEWLENWTVEIFRQLKTSGRE